MIKIMKGVIDRRVLVNYRLDPECVSKILPPPFLPRLFGGYALGGICLIRFTDMRPAWLPKLFGTSSENGTHRFCVEWTVDGNRHTGIYVKQRFTNSRLHAFGGGKVFPGNLTFSKFTVDETETRYHVSFTTNDDSVDVLVDEGNARFPADSVFSTVEEASGFFERDNVGYSPSRDGNKGAHQGVKLNTTNWKVSPLNVIKASSSLFSNESVFPSGSAQIDHSLLMKDIDHDWEVVDKVCCR